MSVLYDYSQHRDPAIRSLLLHILLQVCGVAIGGVVGGVNESMNRLRSTVNVGVIGVVAHVPSISHLFQVVECGQVLLLMYRIIEYWISVRYFSFFLFYQTR